MISGLGRAAIFLCREAVDMRKSFDSLSAVVKEHLHMEPLGGAYFAFIGKDRRRAKVLYWDGTGLCVFSKRLEKGKFVAPWLSADPERGTVKLTVSELLLLLEGSEWVGRVSLSPAPLVLERRENFLDGAPRI
ncbi:MAG: IS66 family insertion sequence element accessory protein TnpB [Bdellovibrionota bacterium]